MLRSCRSLALVLLLPFAACSVDDAAAPVIAPDDARIARSGGGKPDTASRANLVWADQVNVAGPGQPEDWRPAGIQGDGRLKDGTAAAGSPSNEYQGAYCGVAARINNARNENNALSYDPDARYDAATMQAACGSARAYRFFLGGPVAAPTLSSPQSFVDNIWTLSLGESRQQAQGFGVQLSGCDRLMFSAKYPPASDMRVTRLPDVTTASGKAARQWRVESQGSHVAMCVVADKRGVLQPTGVSYYLPFALTVTEVPYPYQTYP